MTRTPRLISGLWLLSVLGCTYARPLPPVPDDRPAVADLAFRLFLIGDAGAPSAADPVLRHLGQSLAEAPERSQAIFLGDNIYPRGLPSPENPDRAEAERRLAVQVDVVRNAGAGAVFVPGNHDWAKHGPDGWDAIRRQADFLETRGEGRISLLPAGGCPGPVVRDWPGIRVIFLDTQWWLHRNARPDGPEDGCATWTEAQVTDSLRAAVAGAGARQVVMATHHPLASGGEHGGHFDWTRHVFPLRALKGWAWLPLPLLGSLYPAIRASGISDQDIPGSGNRHMREALAAAVADHPPLVWAAGHEHNLQVMRGTVARHLVVSGSGYFGHGGFAQWSDSTVYASDRSGYTRLDLLADGRMRLAVVAVDREGKGREVYAEWLEHG